MLFTSDSILAPDSTACLLTFNGLADFTTDFLGLVDAIQEAALSECTSYAFFSLRETSLSFDQLGYQRPTAHIKC